jgi:hypothetical protein
MRLALPRLVSIALTCLSATVAVRAADVVKPDIKPGLWEVSDNPQITGKMPIPDEELAKLTPEQRARMEAAMKNAAGKTHVYKECMTPEKIARFDMNPHGDDSSCKRKVISSTPHELTLHDEMTVNTAVQGKWLATDCGSVTDAEPVKP